MVQNRYTGELAYYATMVTLVSAMQSCNVMVRRPSKTIAQLASLLQTALIETAPPEIARSLADPELMKVLRDHIDREGLTVMSVLQCIKKYDTGKRSLSSVC